MKQINITCTSDKSGVEIHKILVDIFYDSGYSEEFKSADWKIKGGY